MIDEIFIVLDISRYIQKEGEEIQQTCLNTPKTKREKLGTAITKGDIQEDVREGSSESNK